MALRESPALKSTPRLYTAQDVARFCEVDLKTVHHWADRGKVPHFRTEGRHLRFRRNDVVRFLRAHGYPLPDALRPARKPVVALAPLPGAPEDLPKKLAPRFAVRRFDSGLVAALRLLADEPDAIVLALDDPTLAGLASISAIKGAADTAWVLVALIAPEESFAAAREAGAEIVLAPHDVTRLGQELARGLAL